LMWRLCRPLSRVSSAFNPVHQSRPILQTRSCVSRGTHTGSSNTPPHPQPSVVVPPTVAEVTEGEVKEMSTVGVFGVVAVASVAVLAGQLWNRYAGAAIRPLLMFRSFKLIERTTVSHPEASLPTVRFRFAIEQDGMSEFDLGKGDHIKLARGDKWTKPKSYSPLVGGVGGSDETHKSFDLVVKIYPRNGTSQWLNAVQVGESVRMSGPFPPPVGLQKVRNGGDVINIVCYGVGITEAIAVAEAELNRADVNSVTMLWSNRGSHDEVLTESVDQLQKDHPNRFTVLRAYSRQTGGDFEGRVDGGMIKTAFNLTQVDPENTTNRFLIVGTKEMIKETWIKMESMGFTRKAHDLLQKPGVSGLMSGLMDLAAGTLAPQNLAKL